MAEGIAGKSIIWGGACSRSYMLPEYHVGTRGSDHKLSDALVGITQKKDPCTNRTCNRGGPRTLWPIPNGGKTVMEVRRTEWCCKAAQPSVARRADHLRTAPQVKYLHRFNLLDTLYLGKRLSDPHSPETGIVSTTLLHHQRTMKATFCYSLWRPTLWQESSRSESRSE
jgi:hypothetical protein